MMFCRIKPNNLIIVFFLLCISCKHSYQEKITVERDNAIQNFFIHANKKIIQNEEVKIDSLIKETEKPPSCANKPLDSIGYIPIAPATNGTLSTIAESNPIIILIT